MYARTTQLLVATGELAIHEKSVVVRLESALTSDLKTAENYGSAYGVENGATFRSNTTTPFLKRRLREIVTDVRTLYE